MEAKYLAYGALRMRFQGELSLLRGSLLERFEAPAGTSAVTVTLRTGELPPVEPAAAQLYQMPGTVVFKTNRGWHRRFLGKWGNTWVEFAALDYSDSDAVLTISPACKNIPGCVESCTAFEHLSLCAGALPIHASHIQFNGRAIVFAAASGVGKSTQAALWEAHRDATVINGDKSLLLSDGTQLTAAGIPYAGTSQICKNQSAPLQAVVLLEQGAQNTITKLQGAAAVMRLMTCVIRNPWHDTDAERALSLAAKIVQTVPIFCLRCLPDVSAVECLEAALKESSK